MLGNLCLGESLLRRVRETQHPPLRAAAHHFGMSVCVMVRVGVVRRCHIANPGKGTVQRKEEIRLRGCALQTAAAKVRREARRCWGLVSP